VEVLIVEQTDILTPADRAYLEEIAEQAAQGSTMCSQVGMVPTLTEQTKKALHKTAVELTAISARLSRIVILAD
jgi:hypothetical protein